jgi:hypothetical protein
MNLQVPNPPQFIQSESATLVACSAVHLAFWRGFISYTKQVTLAPDQQPV